MPDLPISPSSNSHLPLSSAVTNTRDAFSPVLPEGVTANIAKGGSAADFPPTTLVLDTGQPEVPPKALCTPNSQAELDKLYRETIRRGIIDHHSIDAAVRFDSEISRYSTTGMIARYSDLVLEQIERRGISEITSHKDSDLDSLAASYLAQSLKQNKELPVIAGALASHVDLVDFGLYRVPPSEYVTSLAGVFSALKRVNGETARAEFGGIFSDQTLSQEEKSKRAAEVSNRFEQELIKETFAILNGCERAARMGLVNLDNLSELVEGLDGSLKEKILRGQNAWLHDLEIFEREHAAAIRGTGVILDKDGKERQVPVLIFENTSLNPLLVTNLCYTKEGPETVVAVFAGADRKGGDAYNIGIKTETTQIFTLHSLATALSEREGELRLPLLADLKARVEEGTASEDERKRLNVLTTPRKGFEHLKIGDPTVCVAGGSLVAASTNSLMSRADFLKVVREALQI